MISLRDLWQTQRQQRQQEAIQRRQQVQETLLSVQQERQSKAVDLRDDLSRFRDRLMQENAVRRANLQQFRLKLQQETQTFLASASDRRQAQAEQVAQQLDEFVQALQVQTAQFLSLTAADRVLMAHQLAQDLGNFHVALNTAVASLRRELQTEVTSLKQETQELLAASYQQRVLTQAQLTKDLVDFMEKLRSEVQSYLWELELISEDRAHQTQQTLKQSRENRLAAVQELFERLADFRTDLKVFHVNVQKSVWGTVSSSQSNPASPALLQQQLNPVGVKSVTVTPPAPTSVSPTATAKASVKAEPVAVLSTQATQQNSVDHEKAVYNYIHQALGARLTEIESALNINRFQTVDALRSLIQKGLITQRDRVYLTQEDFSL